jgi:L-Ala-D/L-Glu epimerase
MELKFRRVDWEFRSVFRIAYRTQTHTETVLVELAEDGHVGRGEACGVSYYDETAESLLDQLAGVERDIRGGITPAELQLLLPAGGARNALDCAMWDLRAKRSGRRAWDLAGIHAVRPLQTMFTLGLDTPQATAKAAAACPHTRLKLKVGDAYDLERVTLVRAARPAAVIVVDANQGWSEHQLHELTPRFAQLGVILIEQPLPAGNDGPLAGIAGAVPLCADESCHTSESLPLLSTKYQCVNIKLDKTGGLTEALRLARSARALGFKLMVGCMGGSSLSMAPAFVLGQLCDLVDLDAPLLNKTDVANPIRYQGDDMFAPEQGLWG